jgi:hypothetical protein
MTTFYRLLKQSGWIIFTIWLLQANVFCSEIDHVTGLHSITHVSHQSSNNTQIIVKWDPPLTGEHNITGYYYQFDTLPDYEFTMDNTTDPYVTYISQNAPRQAVSPNYSESDDRAYYCHVAAVNEMTEIIGSTLTCGPYRIDDVAPYPATVIAPSITSD